MNRLCLLLLAAALSLAGCTSVSLDPPAMMTSVAVAPTVIAKLSTPTALQASTEKMEQGVVVYRSQYCGVCHRLTAAETTGEFGPSHDGLAWTAQARLMDPGYVGHATTPTDYLHESIVAPDLYFVEGYELSSHHMPSYVHLQPQEIEAIVYLLAHQR